MVEFGTAVFVQLYETAVDKLHQELLLKNVVKYYTKDNGLNLSRIIPIIERTSDVSLRLLDWCIVSYAKEKDITYVWQGKPFNVFSNYRQQLNHYSKKYFDAFRRHSRTYIYFENRATKTCTDMIETTLGQLIFFRWCLDNGLIEFVSKNAQDITDHMKSSMQNGHGIVHLQRNTLDKNDNTLKVSTAGSNGGGSSSDATFVKTDDFGDGETSYTTTTTMSTTSTTSSDTRKRIKSEIRKENPRRAFSATRYIDSSYTLDFS